MAHRSATVLAVDPGTSFGLCVLRGEEVLFLGSAELTALTPSGRLDDLWDWLFQMAAWRPELLVLEGYSFNRQGKGSFTLAEFGGVIKLFAGAASWKILLVAPQSLKKFVVGRGSGGKGAAKVEKVEVALNVMKRWGVEVTTEHQADAYGLARLGMNVLVPGFETLTVPQREVVAVYGVKIEEAGGKVTLK